MRVFEQIMLVDDDPITSVVLHKINHTLPFAKELVSFYSAVDGLDYLTSLHETNQRQPEVIFLDITMPIVSGWQFLERYAALPASESKIFMLTASRSQSDIIRAKKCGDVEDYLVKPLTLNYLHAIQDRLLSSSPRAASPVM